MVLAESRVPHCSFCEWLVKNEDKIRCGGLEYQGIHVTESSQIVCYGWNVSFLFFTLEGQTTHTLSELDKGDIIATACTAFLGWWSFPWGPISTIRTLWRNCVGGKRCSVSALLAEQRWGVLVVDHEILQGHNRQLADFSIAAVVEIERRRVNSGFSSDLAVKPVPDDWHRRTCLIQFDYPVSDGRQWVFRTQSLSMIFEKSDATYFDAKTIDFDGSEFVVRERFEVPATDRP